MNIEKYLKHASGIFALLKALNYYEQTGINVDVKEQLFVLGYEFVDYYSFGSVKRRKGVKYPFLAVQEIESKWFGLIEWERIVIKNNDLHVYFISKTIKGDGENYADLPSFIVGLPLENHSILEILKTCEKIDGREVFVESEEEGVEAIINFTKKLFCLEISLFDGDLLEALSKEKFISNKEIVKRKIEKTNINYVPEYKGETNYNIGKEFEHFLSKKKDEGKK